MFDCLCKNKCKWCGKRKKNKELLYIDVWCKWYGMYICESCYDKKRNEFLCHNNTHGDHEWCSDNSR